MPSLYAQYIAEHHGDSIIENETGFASYRFLNGGKTVYIVDIYIRPDCRRDGAAATLADKVVTAAKQQGCTELLGTVVPSAKNSTDSLRVLLGYEMSLSGIQDGMILFRKELK